MPHRKEGRILQMSQLLFLNENEYNTGRYIQYIKAENKDLLKRGTFFYSRPGQMLC